MLPETTAILLVNLGTPDGYDFFSVRKYLKQFLSDKRIVELNPILWLPILHGIILNTRPRTSGRNYKHIWHRQSNQSPLLLYTKAQTEKLSSKIATMPNLPVQNIKIYFAMRYGNPSIASMIQKLTQDGCKHILLLPLFPQYSATTTASIYDDFFGSLLKLRNVPSVTTIRSFATNPSYIQALANSINTHLKHCAFEPELIIASFHGIPKSYVAKGDPYYEECCATIKALREHMRLSDTKLLLSFQSRFGKEEWLQPYTDKLTQRLAQQGIRKIAIFNPGFISDCLETIDEIGREIKEVFIHNGGTDFTHIPCLNDSDEAINMLSEIIQQSL